jgi:hypothetical protein
MDGFRFRINPLGSHPHAAALIQRSTDQPNLAYLVMTGTTCLTGVNFLSDLPLGVQLELRGATLVLTCHPSTDLAQLDLRYRDCGEAEFKDGV